MDGGSPSTPVAAKKGQKQGRKKSSGGAEAEGEEDSDEEPSSSSPISALDNFRSKWEEELRKVTTASNVNSALNLVSASAASLSNPFPNPLSMAGAVSKSKDSNLETVNYQHEHHPFFSSAAGKLGEASGVSNSESTGADVSTLVPDTGTDEEQARRWFLQGVGFERHGDLYDAVRCYRRAVQLVPDIEYRISQGLIQKNVESEDDSLSDSDSNSDSEHSEGLTNNEERDNEEEDDGPLMQRFLKIIEKRGWQFFEKTSKTDKKHLCDLPIEVVSYIMRWVVSSDLDIRSLDVLSTTCKGFYCVALDEKLWQMICSRLWGSCVLSSAYSSYREMYINRPRVRFDGCYISRVTYIRAGENSFQDQSYRPWHFVEYYRYIRFFPDGECYFLTTSDEPTSSVPGLKEKFPRNLATLKGTYQLYGNNIVTAMVKKLPVAPSMFKTKRIESQQTTSFHIEFEICTVKGRHNWMLKWAHHAAFTTKTVIPKGRYNNRQNNNNSTVTSTTFDLSPTKYPPLYFSRVKSYTTRSENILE